MALTCDWCDEPIEGEGFAYMIVARPFSILDLDRGISADDDAPSAICPGIHVHEQPCREHFLTAAGVSAREHIPLEDEIDHKRGNSLNRDEEKAKDCFVEDFRPKAPSWQSLARPDQDRRVLEVFEDGDTLGISNIYKRLDMRGEDQPLPRYPQSITAVVTRLVRSGELKREEVGEGSPIYRLTPPSTVHRELERRLLEGAPGGRPGEDSQREDGGSR